MVKPTEVQTRRVSKRSPTSTYGLRLIPTYLRPWIRKRLFEDQRGLCAICKEQMRSAYTGAIDHRKPVSAFTQEELEAGVCNDYYNLQLTHRRCDSDKGNTVSGDGQQ